MFVWLQMTRGFHQDQGTTLEGPAYVAAEYSHVWQQIQEECQLLLGQLLHAPLRMRHDGADSGAR